MITIDELNSLSLADFVALNGGVFEHSPWVAEGAASSRPFAGVIALHAAMVSVVAAAPEDLKMELIRAHPDLAGRLAKQGLLTAESTREQASAGISGASSDVLEKIEKLNGLYRARFHFPFIICARLNKVDTIVAAMDERLGNAPDTEVATALDEIYKIARLRLADIIED